MRRYLICLLLILALVACQGRKAPAPAAALPDIEQMPREALLKHLHAQMEMNTPDRKPNEEYRDKNARSYFGCLDYFKNDDCRFMRCSPYALYAADEYLLGGLGDEAFKYYTAAFNLIKEEVAGTIEKQNKWKAEYDALVAGGKATEQDKRHYLFRRCTTSERLFRNHAEIARILLRYALIFDRQQKKTEADNARAQAEDFLGVAADAYAAYFDARRELTPLLNPQDPQQLSFYIATIKDTDELLHVPRL